MKKLLLSAVAVLGLLPGLTSTTSAVLVEEDRSGWIIKGCSQRPASEPMEKDGDLTRMLDGRIDTYWHSYWKGHDAYNHYFYIDRGENLANVELSAIGYTPRQTATSGNGYVNECDIYILDNIDGLITMGGTGDGSGGYANGGHESLEAFVSGKTPTAHGTFNYTYNDASNRGESKVTFSTPTAGRYILFVATKTNGDSNNDATYGTPFCNCAEFNAYVNSVDPADLFAEALDANNINFAQKMALIKNVVGGTDMPSVDAPEDLTVDNVEAKAAEVNTAITNYINSFNGKRITIASTRRTNNPYLAAIPTGNNVKMNTQAEISPDAVWEIVMQTSGFKLYNRTTGKYIDNGGGVYFPKQNGNGIALAYEDGNNGLNVDTEAYMSNLTTWGSGDDGSRWNIEPAVEYVFAAPETSTADTPKYYRILNARWMHEKASPCMGALGENQEGSGIGETMTRAQATIPGVYWRIESVDGDNGVKLINLVGYELTINGENGKDYVTLTETGSTFYLHKQTAEQFAGIEECYAIASGSEVTSENCLDATNSGTRGAKIVWNPTRDNYGHGDNGSLWYFIPATDAEIATATETYINNVKARISIPLVDESLCDLLGKEVYNAVYAEAAIPEYDVTTVSGVNAAKYVDFNTSTDVIKSAVKAKFAETAPNNSYMLRNCNSGYSNCYMTEGQWRVNEQAEYYTAITPAADASNLAALWAFDYQDADTLKIRNVQSGLFVDIKEANNQSQPMTTDGFEYVIDYNPIVPGFNFLAKGKDAINGIHQSDNNKICRWHINNIPGSHWTILSLADADTEIITNAENHTLTFPGLTLNTHESAANLVITITKASETEEPEIALASIVNPDDEGTYTIAATDIVDGVATLSYIREGNYVVNVPAGMFLANGIPTAAFTDKFSVDANGGVTGIEEIAAGENNAQTVIYDLQGRRLSAPVKGINIINGKKVLVK